MSLRLRDIRDCFEGVVPSVVATLDSEGLPNVSYVSQVWYVDEDHVALSNQFLSKTAANVQATGRATVLVVDGRTGDQYELHLAWVGAAEAGETFERMAAHLRAISSQHGLEEVMRLKSADIYRVESACAVASPAAAPLPPAELQPEGERLAWAARLAAAIAAEEDAEAMVDRALDGLAEGFGFRHAMLLVPEPGDAHPAMLTTLASRGYAETGTGSQAPVGSGVIGIAAETRRPLRICDYSRGRRFAEAVRSETDVDESRVIPLPGLPLPQSQLAVPMIAQGRLAGVLFAEAPTRFRFSREDEDAVGLIGTQLAACLRLAELHAARATPLSADRPAAAVAANRFRVTYHAFDDSLFIDDAYIIKGVPGRLLFHFLSAYVAQGRREFTNREIRLDPELRLPDLKDNLETRLILLRRRLDERGAPVRLLRPGRGRIELELSGTPELKVVSHHAMGRPT